MPGARMIPLCVPFWDERAALDAGALYSQEFGFHVLAAQEQVRPWLPAKWARPGAALMPDMLPVTTWEINARALFGGLPWERMRKHCYKAAGFRCEICGARGPLEAHERFELENETAVQRLTGLLCLCPLCHKGHHLGFARRAGMAPAVLGHMAEVNGWSLRELQAALAEAEEAFEQRKDWPWAVDLSWLQSSGYLYV